MLTVWVLVAILQTGEVPLATFLNSADCYAAARNAVNEREVCVGFPLLGSDAALKAAPVVPQAAPAPARAAPKK